MINFFSKIFFRLHFIGIYIVRFGWIIYPKILYLHPIIFLAWYLNNNKCIITQIEYKLFNSTFLGNGNKFNVPKFDRYLLYFCFIIGSFYNLIINFKSSLL
jgi:hypothetical protein